MPEIENADQVNTIDGSVGGQIIDQPGYNRIVLGEAAAMVSAAFGEDTIVGGTGDLTVDATENASSVSVLGGTASDDGAAQTTVGALNVLGGSGALFVQAGDAQSYIRGSSGDTTVIGGSERTALLPVGPTTVTAGSGPVVIQTSATPFTILSSDGAESFTWAGGPGDTLTVTTDSNGVSTIADVMQLFDSVHLGGQLPAADDLLGPETANPFADQIGNALIQFLAPGEAGAIAHQVYYTPGSDWPILDPAQAFELVIGQNAGGTPVILPTAVQAVNNTSANPVTVQGGGGGQQFVVSSGGDFSFDTGGGSGVVLANDALASTFGGQGNATVTVPDSGGGSFVISTGAGDDVIAAGSGSNSISAGTGSNLVWLRGGSNIFQSEGADTVVANAGATTVVGADTSGVSNDMLLFGGGQLTFLNGIGISTVVGGSGSSTILGGRGGGLFFGGTAGNNVLVGGGGAATLIGGGAGDQIFATGASNDVLFAGSGSGTLSAGGSTGNNMIFGGSGDDILAAGRGNDTLVGGGGRSTILAGSGNDLIFAPQGGGAIYAGSGASTVYGAAARGNDAAPALSYLVNQGQAGGSELIYGFRATVDTLVLGGYDSSEAARAAETATQLGDVLQVTLSDGTRIGFAGLNDITQVSFG